MKIDDSVRNKKAENNQKDLGVRMVVCDYEEYPDYNRVNAYDKVVSIL